jgi:hypothetical protein
MIERHHIELPGRPVRRAAHFDALVHLHGGLSMQASSQAPAWLGRGACAESGLVLQLCFEALACPLAGTCSVRYVQVRDVPPALLCRARVCVRGQAVIDLRSVENGRGGCLSAGDMILAMAAMEGYRGLVISLPQDRSAPRDLQVELWLAQAVPGCGVWMHAE